MKLLEYYRGLDRAGKDAFAARAQTTRRYLDVHIMRSDAPTREAGDRFKRQLADASEGNCSMLDVFEHFNPGTVDA